MVKHLERIKQILDKKKECLSKNYNVESIGVFGSVVREENTKTSDIDLLVKFSKPIGMFKFIKLEEYLSQLLGKKVDLVTRKALKPAIKKEILQQTIYV